MPFNSESRSLVKKIDVGVFRTDMKAIVTGVVLITTMIILARAHEGMIPGESGKG